MSAKIKQVKRKPKRNTRVKREQDDDANITVDLSKRGAPFPPTVKDDCLWVHSSVLASGAASFNIVDFPVNSLDDPEGSGGSTQPTGYLRLMGIYALYRCLRVQVHLEVLNRESDQELVVGIGFSDTQPSTILTSYDRVDSFYENTLLTRSGTLGWASGSNSKLILPSSKAMSYYWDMPLQKVIGNKGNLKYDNSFQAAYGASPNNIIWLALTVQNIENGVTIPNGISYRLTVKFFALFTSLRPDQEIFSFLEVVKRLQEERQKVMEAKKKQKQLVRRIPSRVSVSPEVIPDKGSGCYNSL